YQLAPGWMINATALLLPWIELFSGIALIIAPRLRHGAAILILGMLVVFTSAIAIDLYRGIDITCGCFTSGGKGQHIGTMKMLENLAMIAGACFLAWRERPGPGPKYTL
ncbi:MAG TPA: MauE/DoxX family redox-associated membrane protein, partial [Kiritimatiellia bacterium]